MLFMSVPGPTGTDYQVELVSAQLRHLVKAVGWGWAFFLSRLRRADSKLFALLLRTLATESNLTLPNRALVVGSLGASAGLLKTKLAPAIPNRAGAFFVRGIAVRSKASRCWQHGREQCASLT
jgi:hypothetical protein